MTPIALIVTMKDEEEALWPFLESIDRQTLRPDVTIITVARSSTDKTADIVSAFAHKHGGANIRWFWTDGNRSVGRNDAALHAISELGTKDIIIACTNVCVLHDDWLRKITLPLEYCGDVCGGSYRIDARTMLERAAAAVTQYGPKEIVRKKFVTALSMAFTAKAWDAVGGFPEELDTSEDTVFAERLRAAGYLFRYEPRAIVDWKPSTLSLRGTYRTYKQFAATDRTANVLEPQYYATTAVYVLSILLLSSPAPLLGLLIYLCWLAFRGRKGSILSVPYIIAMDLARIGGYWL